MKKHFVYIGKTEHCVNDEKIGKSTNLYNRQSGLNTSYSRHSLKFKYIIKCENPEEESEIEEDLHEYFYDHSTTRLQDHCAGIEWFDKIFTKSEIENALRQCDHDNQVIDDPVIINKLQDRYDKLNSENKLKYREKMSKKKLLRRRIIKMKKLRRFVELIRRYSKMPKPDFDQKKILDKINIHFMDSDKGIIIEPCGLGKTLLSIFTLRNLNSIKICIGVNSIDQMAGFKEEILRLFPNKNNILCLGGHNSKPIEEIKQKLDNICSDSPIFIITTYASCHKLVDDDIYFDFKIADECHHLTSIVSNTVKSNLKFHDIKTNKTLFMTATAKYIDTITNDCFSMDNEEQFGEIIDERTVKWAIENKKITDYMILLLKNTEDEVEVIMESVGGIDEDKVELFISAYMALKALNDYDNLTHIFLYCNNIVNSKFLKGAVDTILDKCDFPNINREQLYNKALYSDSHINITEEKKQFINSQLGIISCVYIFGEGTNLPCLNGIVVCENMVSENRIVQSCLRPNRLDYLNPDKIAYLIIPYIMNDRYGEEKYKSFDKVFNIVKNMGLVDKNIEQRIKVNRINCKYERKDKKEFLAISKAVMIDDVNELNLVKTRLKHRRSLNSHFSTEESELNYRRELNRKYGFQSKQDYFNLETEHECYIGSDPEGYFKKNGVWNSWQDFLGYDTSSFPADKSSWKRKCTELGITSYAEYKKKCRVNNLPEEPNEIYDDFLSIYNELPNKTKRRR